MTDENSTTTDLWGNTVYVEKRKKGRPKFEWTPENSRKISMLLAVGWSNQRIADCVLDPRTGLSISIATLKRYFRAELAERDAQRDRLNARQLMVAADKAFNDGNVGAMRLLDKLIDKNDLMKAAAALDAVQGKGAKEAAPLGKKEQALLDAQEAASGDTSGWGDDLKPGFH